MFTNTHMIHKIYQTLTGKMPFFETGFYQGQSVNLRTKTCVLFFEETFLLFNNSLYGMVEVWYRYGTGMLL